MRRKTKSIKIGNVFIGGKYPILVQSMAKVPTKDIASTVCQIKKLENTGCEIIRVAVPDMESAIAIAKIKKEIKIPLVADIHFDYKLAIRSIESGCDKLRINPGNIGSVDRVQAVVERCKERSR